MKKALVIFFIINFFVFISESAVKIVMPVRDINLLIKSLEHLYEQDYIDWQLFLMPEREQDVSVLEHLRKEINDDRMAIVFDPNAGGFWHTCYQFLHAHSCDDDLIILHDGNSHCSEKTTISSIVQAHNDGAWTTYGDYLNHEGKSGNCHAYSIDTLKFNHIRGHQWFFCPLRSFEAWLFKEIKLEDFFIEGSFIDQMTDVILLPILEMAGADHIRYFPHVCSVCLLNEEQTPQRKVAEHMCRLKQPYHHRLLAELPTKQSYHVDIVIFSKDRPIQLYALLESIQQKVKGIYSISVIFHAGNPDYAAAYKKVQQDFSSVQFFAQSTEQPKKDFKRLVLDVGFQKNTAAYIAFAVDDDIILKDLNISEGARMLHQTGAYGIFYKLGRNTNYCYTQNRLQGLPHFVPVHDNWLAWQFKTGFLDFAYPNSVDFVLYKKTDIHQALSTLDYHTPNSLEGTWDYRAKPSMSKIGLCYDQSHLVNIPLNIVQRDNNNRHMPSYSPEYLLEIFNKEQKIDIGEFQTLQPNAAHFEHQPHFIKR